MHDVKKNLLLASLLPFFLAGCINLNAVNEWSTSAVDAAEFNNIVTTYSDTPARLLRYSAEGTDPAAFNQLTELREKQAESLRETLKVVQEYMAALASLSADQPIGIAEDLGKASANLASLGVAEEATLGAVGRIVALLGEQAISGYRARAASRLIEQANVPLQVILSEDGDLSRIVSVDFASDLSNEKLQLQLYFDSLARSPSSPTARAALAEWRPVRVREVEVREKAIASYAKVLRNLADGHQALYDGRNALGDKALANRLFNLAKELRNEVRVLVSAQ